MHFDNNTCYIETNHKLIVGADENGQIKVFDYKKRLINSIECNFKVNEIKMLKDKFVFVGNDVNVYISQYLNKEFIVLYKHTDFVNCLDVRDNIVVSGSIDKKVMVYDLEAKAVKNTISFDSNISKIRFIDENNIIVIARYQMYMVDINTSSIVRSTYIHTKDTTGLVLYNNVIYTSSLDGNLKSWTMDFKFISQVKFEDKILSFDIYENEVFIGLDNGKIYKTENDDKKEEKKEIEVEIKRPNRYYRDEDDKNIKRIKYTRKYQNEID